MRIFAALLIALWLLSGNLWAEEIPTASKTVPKQLRHLAQSGPVNGRFVQNKTLQGLDIPLRSEGHFALTDDTLLWQVTSPIASELQISRDAIVQLEDGREVFRLSAAEQPLSRVISDIFLAVFQGDWALLQQHFDLQVSGSADDWQLQLLPLNDVIGRVAGRIDVEGGAQLQSLQLAEPGGDRTRIEFFAPEHGHP
ncbi:LolA-related protein [Pseudomaricurvus sp. HS19]|uniref:LolA-related protein n=1 Tax=Pseudomaricurvus sp. HS19 TaxID=2692626 RepID=UPI001371BE77|nr:hypothetical protein [Pseudomaricurvus sp. HS19]